MSHLLDYFKKLLKLQLANDLISYLYYIIKLNKVIWPNFNDIISIGQIYLIFNDSFELMN